MIEPASERAGGTSSANRARMTEAGGAGCASLFRAFVVGLFGCWILPVGKHGVAGEQALRSLVGPLVRFCVRRMNQDGLSGRRIRLVGFVKRRGEQPGEEPA